MAVRQIDIHIGEHKQKANHDKEIAESLQTTNKSPDWVVICSFYSALHSVDACAHKYGVPNFDPAPDEKTTAHQKRLRWVEKNLRDYFGRYNVLLSHSEQCRYDPSYFKKMLPIVPLTMIKLAKQFLEIK